MGYHSPLSAIEQLAEPRRRQWLQMLWDYSSLPKEMYQQYYLQPLERCVVLMQQFPATENGHHVCLGGMVDHLLETTAYAARLSKSYLLPVGAPPEEQATQSAAWNAVIVYAAMLQSLDALSQIEVELESGKRWIPLGAEPEEPYRFRFRPVTDAMQLQSLAAMRAWKIVPDEALLWLSNWPEALKALSLYLTGFRNESGIINAIVLEAIRTSTGSALPESQANNLTVTPTTLPPVASEIVLPPAASPPDSGTSPVPVSPPTFARNTAPVKLVSALDSTLPGRSADEVSAVATSREDDAAGNLLAVMGFAELASVAPNNGGATAIAAVPERRGEAVPVASVDIGEQFWQWLSEGCCSDSFAVNTSGARVHIIADYVFIRTPGIFHQFLQENNSPADDKSAVQNAFERLGWHRQDNGVMYTCHLYQNKEKKGRFQKLSGYLILARKLYKRHNIPGENPLLVIKHQNNQGVMP